MKKFLLIISSVFVFFFFTGCGDEATTIIEDSGSFDDLKVQGNKTYTLKTTEGKTITFTVENEVLKSKELNGKIVLINFWATWCAPCLKEIPTLNTFYKEYGDNFEIIGVLMEKNKDAKALAEFMTKFNMKFPVSIGEENYRMAKAFDDVKMFPESFLYDQDGKFLEHYVGEVKPTELKTLIDSKL